jgi:hypothetical protein
MHISTEARAFGATRNLRSLCEVFPSGSSSFGGCPLLVDDVAGLRATATNFSV